MTLINKETRRISFCITRKQYNNILLLDSLTKWNPPFIVIHALPTCSAPGVSFAPHDFG